jgi:phage terminase small subunit
MRLSKGADRMPPGRLTGKLKKRRFAQEYLRDLNARRAAIRAGIPPKGAHTQATRLLKDVYVRACIEKAQAKLALRYDLTQDKIIRDVIDIGDAALADGNFATALKAKELIGRHIGMWSNKAEVTGPNGGPIPVRAATVVLPIEAMNPEQREALRSALLLAKAKERAMSQAQEAEEKE